MENASKMVCHVYMALAGFVLRTSPGLITPPCKRPRFLQMKLQVRLCGHSTHLCVNRRPYASCQCVTALYGEYELLHLWIGPPHPQCQRCSENVGPMRPVEHSQKMVDVCFWIYGFKTSNLHVNTQRMALAVKANSRTRSTHHHVTI